MSDVKNTTVKRKKRKKHPMKSLISLIMIGLSCFLFYAAFQDITVMLNLKSEISANNTEIETLTKQKEDLTVQKKKLEDPEYVKRYARDKYLVTKEGEQVFKLPGGSDEESEDE